MVHRGGIETSTEKNKKDDFNSCIAENAKTADDEISADKIEESAPKAKQQLKKLTKKASPKSTPLPLSDHSISQTVVRLERSRLIKTKNNPNSKADNSSGTGAGASAASTGVKAKHLSPVRPGLRSSSLESHTSTTSNNNNAKAKKKKANVKKTKASNNPIESAPQETVKLDTKNAQPKVISQLPRSFICSLPLNRLSGILEKLKADKAKCLTGAEEDASTEDKSNADQNSSQCKTLCLYCDKRMSTVKVRARHIERFHTISKERRSSSRNPATPSSQDPTKDLLGTSPAACSSSSTPCMPTSSTNLFFSGCSFCSKSPKLQAVALEIDLNALFYHLVDFHSDKYFGCKLCATRFQNAAKLDDHVQRTHTPTTITKISNPAVDINPPLVGEDDGNLNELDKSTPTKTRRQLKQSVTEIASPPPTKPSSASSSSMNRNGSMFSSDEPILSRLGLTQNRLPRGRKGIRSRRQTTVDSVKPETTVINVKTRSKLGKVCTSNEPVETVFRTPTNTRIEPLSCTFDEDFYEKVFNNVKTNLSCHLDGKLGNESDSNRPQSPPPLMPAIRSTVVKSPHVSDSEVHTATSLATLTAFPTLLTAEQYGCDFGTAKIKRPITRHSWKWKWDSVKKYKYINEGGKIVKKIKQPMLGLRDLSKLDMWTQLTMRQKHEVVRKQSEAMSSLCLVEYSDNSREEKQKQVDQLNTILDSRRLPQISLEQNEQTIIKLEITDEGFRYLAGEISSLSPLIEEPSTSLASTERVIPANLNLIPSRLSGESLRHSVVLSGEWARPRCYVCFGCGARFDKLKALEEHKMFRHPHVYSTHYEIVGRELMEGNLYKHFFIPLKALSRHKEYAQRILVNKKTEYNVSTTKSSSNSGNEEESLDSLHSATASFTTLSSSKLSDDCDTDTKTAIENVTSFTEPSSEMSTKNDTNLELELVSSSTSSMDCTKCKRNCHGMLELYRHMLDCSGDYAWILAKKKKYRYYGSRRRRQFNRQNISSLHLHRRKVKLSKDENESDETPKKKTSNMSPSTPRPRASDADSIRKMLENLPPKRVCREIIPNATKPRSRKFKTSAVGRKIQQTNTNKKSNTTLTAMSKKILRNHKLRAISEKDKITRNKKILETKRKSARVNNTGGVVVVNKNSHLDSKTNKKTESGNGRSIVRKIGATTKRFVKKIKKRLLGERKSATVSGDAEKKVAEEKKPTKISAVRKLTFDKEQDGAVEEKVPTEADKPAAETEQSMSNVVEKNSPKNIQEKVEPLPSENKLLVPTITVETDFEPKKHQDTSLNEDSSFRSEGSTENLHQQHAELSASTEELHRLNPGFLQNQVSPTTKRRSKKINDCIAMLTGKIQEKLGKPFLECKETQGTEGANAQSSTDAPPTLPQTPEIKDSKPPKRKAFTRRIVKCDQTTESATNLDAPPPVAECPPKKQPSTVTPTREPSIRKTTLKQSPIKELPLEIPQTKDAPSSLQQMKTSTSEVLPVKTTPTKELETFQREESLNKEKSLKVIPLESPARMKESLPKKPHQLKETTLQIVQTKDSLVKEQPVKELLEAVPQYKESLSKEPALKGIQLKDHLREPPIKVIQLKEHSREPPIKGLQVKKSLMEKPISTGLPPLMPPHIELIQKEPLSLKDFSVVKKGIPLAKQQQLNEPLFVTPLLSPTFKADLTQAQVMSTMCNNFKSVSSKRVPPPPVTIEITTPPPVLLSQMIPTKLSQPLPNQHSPINADTIRVPCLKQPQLTIPQFNPVQVPAPRGMITKRRQTIACAPNEFLYEMNSLRCTNDYNDLPFELEVPLDLSKKGKRSSPKAKPCTKPKAPPVHFPQISVKSNAVLMPPVPYHLSIPPQTQIIPIMCESLQPKVTPQSSAPLIPKEVPKAITSTPRKRTTNNKKQEPTPTPTIVTISQVSLNLSTEGVPPPKKVVPPPITPPIKTNLIKEPVLMLPVATPPIVPTRIEPIIKETEPVPETRTEKIEQKDESPNQPKVLEEITAVVPLLTTPLSTADKVTESQPLPVETTEVETVKSVAAQEETANSNDVTDSKGSSKTNKKTTQVTPKKASSPSTTSSPSNGTKSSEPVVKNENKCESSTPESQKQVPTRRSRRNKAVDQSEQKKPAVINDPPPPPPSALKEVEAIAASFLSDDEQETEVVETVKPKQPPQHEASPKPPEKPKAKSAEPEKSKSEIEPPVELEATPKESLPIISKNTPDENLPEPVPNHKETKSTTPKQELTKESAKKPRKRRKNELAAIVADQLMESFKEVDKSRIDDLKRLENLAYEKSEDLLLTGMRLMPTTKRKNVLDNNKKEANTELESKPVNPIKETKKQKSEKSSNIQKDDGEVFKDPKEIPKPEVKIKKQNEEPETKNKITPSVMAIGKDEVKTKPMSLDFSNYRSNSDESWSNRRQNSELPSPANEKSPNSEIVPVVDSKKDKKSKNKKQMKKRDKKIEIENINQLRTGLESFTLSKDVVDNSNVDMPPRNTEHPLSIVGLFSTTAQRNNTIVSSTNKELDASPFGGLSSVKATSSILRPSILAASMDIATNKESTLQTDRKSIISSRDPRLNKNIHTEEGDLMNVPPETVSRLATLRQRRKSFADATPPSHISRPNSRATPSKRSNANSRRSSLAFDDDDDDNYLTAIAKRVNDKIMSAEDKDFNLANDGFDLANSCMDMDDPYGRPSTSMSVRSAPNFNEDRSNMDTMDANTNTDLIDMDVDDDMSVYTTFSQDTTRSKSGRRRRRRRSVLLTRKAKKRNVNPMEPLETFDCHLCNKQFAKAAALNKHQLTIAHVSKVSEQEYLNATRQQQEEKENPVPPSSIVIASPTKTTITNTQPTIVAQVAERVKQNFNAIQSSKLEEPPITPKVTEIQEKPLVEKVAQKPTQHKLPYIPPNSILNQSGIEPISSPEQNYDRYPTKTSSRLTLNPDERLFYECCNILKGSETPLVERTYPIIPPTTYAYDLQVKPVTPKSPNERFSYIKQSTTAEINGKREGGGSTYPRLDVNQFSDISSDSNPACAQPPPILPVNYAQMHVLSGAKDQAVLPNEEGGGSALRSNLPRDNPVLQMGSLATPNLAPAPPLTARTFVNQPSQIGTHFHGIESAATNPQKQNFISPLHSASSQSSTITTTTCRLKTKAAMKGYDNLKVSIPTIGLDMEHALERSPRPGCKLTTLADIALGHETPLSSFTPSLQMHNEQKSKGKLKNHSDITEQQFPAILNQSKENQVPTKKKREKSPVKDSSLVISVHDTESCTPIILSPHKKPESIIPKDIYDFDDSENTPISKAIQSPFKTADDNDGSPKKVIIIPERPFKNIGMEEQEGIKFQKPVTPAINDENSTSTVSYSDRDDFVYGSISGGDDDNEIENENDDNKDVHVNSDESSNSSAFTAKTFENKSLIMGRIFKNAKTKPKTPIEKPVLPTPEPPKQIPKQELDRLFDTLRGMNENRAKEEQRLENASQSSRRRENQSNKRKPPTAAKSSKGKPNTSKPEKRTSSRKSEPSSKEMAQLHAELGMSPAEIAELIGEGQRKSQRRCAVNRPKKLVEIWSSDEFEEFLSTKDIIALIEEKEQQKTKKKRKTSTNGAKKSNSSAVAPIKGNKNDTDGQSVTQSEDDKPTSEPAATPQKTLKNVPPSKPESTKKAKATPKAKGKKKVPTVTANVMAPPKTTSKTQKNPKASTSRSNSSDAVKSNISPFKKPTQKNIISKVADDSESDFETELNRRSRNGGGNIRNRRKTISGKLENDAGSSSSAKKVSGKSKNTPATDSRNQSSNNKSPPIDNSQMRPQARRKRIASEMLYYWSSSSDEEFGRIESPHDDEHHIEESENYQQHGWIVGDSHKKLVTLLAIAKGNKKVDDCAVKETSSKKKS